MEVLSHICEFYFKDNFSFGTKFASESIYDTIQEIAPSFNDTLFMCRWQRQNSDCSKFIVPILTEEGLCFAFNAINSREMYTKE